MKAQAILLFALSAIMFCFSVDATVVPTTASLVGRSDLVVVGKILKVDHPGEDLRQITVEVGEVVYASNEYVEHELSVRRLSTFTVTYRQVGTKANINFSELASDSGSVLLYLRFVPDLVADVTHSFHLELADEWFGAAPADAQTVSVIKDVKRRVNEIFEE